MRKLWKSPQKGLGYFFGALCLLRRLEKTLDGLDCSKLTRLRDSQQRQVSPLQSNDQKTVPPSQRPLRTSARAPPPSQGRAVCCGAPRHDTPADLVFNWRPLENISVGISRWRIPQLKNLVYSFSDTLTALFGRLQGSFTFCNVGPNCSYSICKFRIKRILQCFCIAIYGSKVFLQTT